MTRLTDTTFEMYIVMIIRPPPPAPVSRGYRFRCERALSGQLSNCLSYAHLSSTGSSFLNDQYRAAYIYRLRGFFVLLPFRIRVDKT